MSRRFIQGTVKNGNTMMAAVRRIGAVAHVMAGYWEMLHYTLNHLKVLKIAPVKRVLLRQIYFTGFEALNIILALGLLCGAVVATQVTAIVGGNSDLTVKVLVWTVVREAGSLFAAIIIIARSSPAIASELALMGARGEMKQLERMGIPPMDYLVVPRIVGVALSVVVLTLYFQIIAVGGGLAVSSLFQNVSLSEQLQRFAQAVRFFDLAGIILKSLAFGLLISAISCYHGMRAGHASTEVPKAAIRAVMQSLLAVFLSDLLFAYLQFLL